MASISCGPFQNWPTLVLGNVEWWIGMSVRLKDDRSQGLLDLIRSRAEECRAFCEALELHAAAMDFEFIRDDLASGKLDNQRLADDLDHAARAFRKGLEERYFFRVSEEKRSYFGADFGQSVAEAFPSALLDISEANTCFALERYIASILHTVRATEVVLHALAKEREVEFPNGPLPWQEWQPILTKIDKSVSGEAENMTKGPQKDAFLHFYRGAIGELQALKDVYRNTMMHTRPKKKPPGESEVRDALVVARGLFQRVSERLTEKGKPINWKKKP